MLAMEQWLDVVAHNLANASTNGFKRSSISFDEAFERAMVVGDYNTFAGSVASGPILRGQHTVWETGPLSQTGNDLDVAIASERGLFAVQTPNGVRYTRNGSFSLSPNGELATKDGHLVLDSRMSPISLPPDAGGRIEVSQDGVVSAAGQVLGQLATFDGNFVRAGQGLFTSSNASPMATANLAHRSIELSNVNAVEEMISMIKLNRVFEMAQRATTSQDESTGRLLQSLHNR